MAATDELPEPERPVIVGLYKEKRTFAAIAEQLARSESAVRAIHQRAVKRLRKDLERTLA